jgi:signal peptidase I
MRLEEKYKSEYSTCSGPSMYPTLRGGDGFQLEKYIDSLDVHVGDIIVYPHPGKSIDVVHRIIKLRSDGVITRGDNNNKVDPYVVKYKDIVGKVNTVKRGRMTFYLAHGTKGYIIHRVMLLRKYSKPYIFAPFVLLSKFLTRSKLLNFLHPLIKTKVVYIKRDNKCEIILVCGKKQIGKRQEKTNEWEIRFPYKLFIKIKELP